MSYVATTSRSTSWAVVLNVRKSATPSPSVSISMSTSVPPARCAQLPQVLTPKFNRPLAAPVVGAVEAAPTYCRSISRPPGVESRILPWRGDEAPNSKAETSETTWVSPWPARMSSPSSSTLAVVAPFLNSIPSSTSMSETNFGAAWTGTRRVGAVELVSSTRPETSATQARGSPCWVRSMVGIQGLGVLPGIDVQGDLDLGALAGPERTTRSE